MAYGSGDVEASLREEIATALEILREVYRGDRTPKGVKTWLLKNYPNTCPSCGGKSQYENYCTKCGEQLRERPTSKPSASRKQQCPYCHAAEQKGIHCSNCGRKIKG